MTRIMNALIVTIAAMILVSCSATPEKSSTSTGIASPSPGTPQQTGAMYYTVSGSTITIYNTPNGTMKEEMDFPSGAGGGRKSLYILDDKGNMTSDTIDIEYDRTGVKSVTKKGVAIPRK
jgi:hypothetical protein